MKKDFDSSHLFASSGIFMIVAFGASLLSGYPKEVGDIGMKPVLVGACWGGGLFILMMFIGRYLQRYVPSYRDLVTELCELFSNLNWPTIILISIMAGISEELLFRGVIQSYLVGVTSPLFYNRLYIVLTLIVGLFIGWLYYTTQSLLLVVVLHSIYDILAFACIVKYPHLLGLDESTN